MGRPLVRRLRERGHDVRVLSRRREGGTHLGDLATGEGLAGATAGVELVVHAASDTRRFGRSDLEQTRRLLEAIGEVRHLLYLSIVGIDVIPFGYYRRKLACEQEVVRSGLAHTILRATQFHELVAQGLRALERLPVAPLPGDFRFQSVAAVEVAARLANLLDRDALGRAPDFGGPEVLTLDEMARAWRSQRGRPRRQLSLRVPGRVGQAFRRGLNTTPGHADGRQRWAEFVSTAD